MMQTFKNTVDLVQWAFGVVKRWFPTRNAGVSETHRVEALEVTRDHIRLYRETHTRGKA